MVEQVLMNFATNFQDALGGAGVAAISTPNWLCLIRTY
jgi:hypothetical protein